MEFKFCQMCFLAFIEMIAWIVLLILLMCHINWSWLLNHACVTGTDPTWSWSMIHAMHLEWPSNILLRSFASIIMRNIGLLFYFQEWLHQSTLPSTVHGRSLFSTSLTTLVSCFLCDSNILTGVRWYYDFDLHFPDD